jgi:membrane protein implicated in regulation of membrane protease activity
VWRFFLDSLTAGRHRHSNRASLLILNAAVLLFFAALFLTTAGYALGVVLAVFGVGALAAVASGSSEEKISFAGTYRFVRSLSRKPWRQHSAAVGPRSRPSFGTGFDVPVVALGAAFAAGLTVGAPALLLWYSPAPTSLGATDATFHDAGNMLVGFAVGLLIATAFTAFAVRRVRSESQRSSRVYWATGSRLPR